MSNVGDVSEIVGKRIFFLSPSGTVQNQIITELAQQEYEVYTTRNRDALRRLLKKYPNTVVFVDINEGMPEEDWEFWIKGIMEDEELAGVCVGILTANDDEIIKRKYLLTVKVACGYTVLSLDIKKTVTRVFEVLEKVNAKGRRKYIRATIDKEANTTVNLPFEGEFVHGKIKDISVVGISCTMDGDPDIPKNTLIKDIQIRLQGSLLKVEGIVFGSRLDGTEKVYVFLFTQRINPDSRTKIRKYVQQNLQNKMDAELR
jgi:hypothetical protein